jgi:hypothetical protein
LSATNRGKGYNKKKQGTTKWKWVISLRGSDPSQGLKNALILCVTHTFAT